MRKKHCDIPSITCTKIITNRKMYKIKQIEIPSPVFTIFSPVKYLRASLNLSTCHDSTNQKKLRISYGTTLIPMSRFGDRLNFLYSVAVSTSRASERPNVAIAEIRH